MQGYFAVQAGNLREYLRILSKSPQILESLYTGIGRTDAKGKMTGTQTMQTPSETGSKLTNMLMGIKLFDNDFILRLHHFVKFIETLLLADLKNMTLNYAQSLSLLKEERNKIHKVSLFSFIL